MLFPEKKQLYLFAFRGSSERCCYPNSLRRCAALPGLPLPEFSAGLGAALENSDGGPNNLSLHLPQGAVEIVASEREVGRYTAAKRKAAVDR